MRQIAEAVELLRLAAPQMHGPHGPDGQRKALIQGQAHWRPVAVQDFQVHPLKLTPPLRPSEEANPHTGRVCSKSPGDF